MIDCFNYQCLCRGVNEGKPPYKCECVACPNRVTESHIIMSNRTLVQEEIKYLTKNGGMFIITRDGFTLLAMGYTGELAMKFKEAYIKQFNAMEAALQGKLIEREKGIAVRQALTKALQQSREDERMHGHAYSNYTNCIYRALFGKDAAQLRRDYGLGAKDNLRDAFPQEELAAVQSMERLVSGLVDCGWEYAQIKEFIGKTNSRLAISA